MSEQSWERYQKSGCGSTTRADREEEEEQERNEIESRMPAIFMLDTRLKT
jgi:hypothetical protein